MLSIRDKVSIESIKSTALDQARSVAQTVTSTLVDSAKSYISNLLSPINDLIDQALSLINAGRELINKAKGVASKLTTASVGDIKNVLDPARNSLFPFPSLPDSIPTDLPDLSSDILPIFLNTLTQIKNFGAEAVLDIYKTFENLSVNLKLRQDGQVALEDNFSDIFESMPGTNERLPANITSVENVNYLKQMAQEPSLEKKALYLSSLKGSTYGEIKFIRDKLRALKSSNEFYENIIDSPFSNDVSDLIALCTVGHTIDTPALDPEDWWDNTENITNPDGRLALGPAQILPTTSRYKTSISISTDAQQAYSKLNQLMYYNLYRDRYYNDDLNSGQYLDYGINRHGIESSSNYGFTKLVVSHLNMGDYSSLGFAKINADEQQELLFGVGDNVELIPLIGYVQNVNNVNSITVKPAYKITINGVEVPVDSRGSRNVLPASKPDDTPVKV